MTAHATAGWPTIYQTQPSEALMQRVVSKLLPDGDSTIAPVDVAQAHAVHGGNVREALFSLFDVYQQRLSQPPGELAQKARSDR